MKPVEAKKLLDEFRYDNSSDAAMRLKGTIVRYEGRPVYILNVFDNLVLQVEDISDPTGGEILEVHSSDPDLDIASPPLGWSNHKKYCIYLMRSARNSQKQGINPSS